MVITSAHTLKEAREYSGYFNRMVIDFTIRLTGNSLTTEAGDPIFPGAGLLVATIGRKYVYAYVDGKIEKLCLSDCVEIEFVM